MLIGRLWDFFRVRARFFPAAAACLLAGPLAACPGPDAALAPLAPDAVVLAYGDSLTWGTGSGPEMQADPARAYPARLQELIGRRVINAGVPGEISEVGLARLPGVLERDRPALVILCHGGNDLLRGLSQEALKSNLRRMIEACRRAGAQVMLLGVPRPRLLLSSVALYGELAREMNVPLDETTLPRILADGALKADLVHPNARGYEELARAVADLLAREGALPPG